MDRNDFSIKERPKKLRDILIIIVLFGVTLICILFLIGDINIPEDNMGFKDRYEILTDGWHAETNSIDQDTTLPIWVDCDRGDIVSLNTTIPELLFTPSVIVTRNYHQVVRAYCDGELIYEFPENADNITDSIITDDWNMIYLPDDSAGKTLTIEFQVGKAGLNGYIEPVAFGEDNSLTAYLQRQYALPYALGIILVLIGMLLIIVTTIYSKTLNDKSHLILGFVFISLGFWFSDRSRMPIFMVGSNIKFFAAFTALCLTPLLLSLYDGERFRKHNQTIPNILIICSIALLVGIYVLIGLGIRPLHALIPYAYLGILITCLYATYLMWYYAHGKGKYQLNQVQLNSVKMEFISAIVLIVGSFMSLIWDAFSSGNWSSSNREWSGVGNIQMISVIIFALFHFIVLIYNSYYGVLESEATQKKLHASQLQLMMGQIQPHFMFNTLSSIRTLIKVDPNVAYEMIYDFSNYLRANVDNITNLDGISFAEEVEHIKNYINIEMVRFGDRLNVEMDIKESDFIVPPLSIQPLVENAIKHGVCKRTEGGTVWLRSYSDKNNYLVEVQDDGVGIPPERMQFIRESIAGNSIFDDYDLTGNGSEVHQSTGLKNICIRLDEISNAHLEIYSEENNGSLMKVIFPKEGQPTLSK